MKLTFMKIPVLCLSVLAMLGISLPSGAKATDKIKVLVVTGGHGFEKESFFKIFEDNPEIAFTAAAHGNTNATAYERTDWLTYDVVVLYDLQKNITERQKAQMLALLNKGIGLLVLHHAVASYQHWPEYERIIGGRYPEEDGKSGVVTDQVGYQHDMEVPVVIVFKEHPVTSGLKDFTIHDEIYWGYRVQPDVTPLITTTHAKSARPLAWAHTYARSRVVYVQLGHDHQAYENPNFRHLLAGAIRWTAKR